MFDVLLQRVAGRVGQPHGDVAADLPHGGRVLDAPRRALHLGAAQVEVLLARLHQAGEPGVTRQIAGFLRGPVGPEGDLPVQHHVVHGDQVRRAVLVDRRQLDLAGFGQEGGYLPRRHGDTIALFHPCISLLFAAGLGGAKPMVSLARVSVSSQAKPAGGVAGADAAEGYQFEIDRNLNHHTGGIYTARRGWIVWPSPENEFAIKPTEWNDYVLTVVGNHHRARLNGVQVIDFTDPVNEVD